MGRIAMPKTVKGDPLSNCSYCLHSMKNLQQTSSTIGLVPILSFKKPFFGLIGTVILSKKPKRPSDKVTIHSDLNGWTSSLPGWCLHQPIVGMWLVKTPENRRWLELGIVNPKERRLVKTSAPAGVSPADCQKEVFGEDTNHGGRNGNNGPCEVTGIADRT
ncbi:hypothetical protein QE357_001317 [Siphonobacter sp. BAB-5404]|nr:hypothetical protein [Siphonobacter sp. SORGH_AS_0500]